MESFDGNGETRNAHAQSCGRRAPHSAERAYGSHMRGSRLGDIRIGGSTSGRCDGRLEPVQPTARKRVSDVTTRRAEHQQRERQRKLSRDTCLFGSCGHAAIPVGIGSARRWIALTVAKRVKMGTFSEASWARWADERIRTGDLPVASLGRHGAESGLAIKLTG